jgi:hypothetical protein
MCSGHFSSWSTRQGKSGFAWSWLGAALQATSLSFGVVNAPGQRLPPGNHRARSGHAQPDVSRPVLGCARQWRSNERAHHRGTLACEVATRNARVCRGHSRVSGLTSVPSGCGAVACHELAAVLSASRRNRDGQIRSRFIIDDGDVVAALIIDHDQPHRRAILVVFPHLIHRRSRH